MTRRIAHGKVERHGRESISGFERVAFASGVYLLFFVCYGIANRLIPTSVCADLTTSIDARIPFIPAFVYPFYLAYILILLPAALVRDRSLLHRSAVAFAVLITLSAVLFVTVPVYVPRPAYIPDSIAGTLVKAIYNSDRPVCGFPSLHVSTSLLAASILLKEHKWIGGISLLFFFLTSSATLFIKQHVLFDVMGGVVMALAVDWLVLRSGYGGLKRLLNAAILNIRNMTTRPSGPKNHRLTESRHSTDGGIQYDLYEPARAVRRTVILAHGLTLQGERDHRLVNFSRSLAESGIRAVAVELPALKSCRFGEEDVSAIIELTKEWESVVDAKIGLIGFSLGAGIVLTAAADPEIAEAVEFVLLFGPYYSLPEVWDALLRKSALPPRNDIEWDDYVWIRMILAYRAIDTLDLADKEKRELVELLESYCFEPSLHRKQEFYERVLKGKDAELLRGGATDGEIAERISPRGRLSAVTAPVMIIHDENDNLISPDQSRSIMEELKLRRPQASQKLLVTPLLSHVTARTAWRIIDIFRILGIMGEIFR